MNVKHFCSSQEEVDARLFLSYTAWILYEKVLQSCTFKHKFHHRWRKQEATNITGTGGTGTWYHKNCSIARLSVWPCRKTKSLLYFSGSCPVMQVLNRSPIQVVAAFADLHGYHYCCDGRHRKCHRGVSIRVSIRQLYEPHTALVGVAELRWRLHQRTTWRSEISANPRSFIH